MKTSVKNIMMSFALMGCLIFSASDAMAQGRSRSQGGSTASRSQSAAVSRSSNSSAAPTVSRASSSSSMSRSSSETMSQVNRSSSSSSINRNTTAPQENRGSNTSMERSTTSTQVNRGSNTSKERSTTSSQVVRGTSTSKGSSIGGSSTVSRRDDSKMAGHTERATATIKDNKPTTATATDKSIRQGGKPGGNGGKPGGNGNVDKDKNGKDRHNDKPGGNGNVGRDNNGKDRPNGNRPGGHGKNDGHGKPGGFGGDGNHFDYSNHHYHNDFHSNYTHHSWSWSRPLPPPARPYRPALLDWYRPVVPYGWHPYTGAPIIDRILGLTFGTLFDTSIEYLYYNGYEIDGYADHVIYLRDVALINHLWDDVMLCFDSGDRLVNAQFVYHSSYNDRNRYRRIYNSLTRVYGSPITSDSRGISWYGGGCNGWITLSTHTNLGHYYMTLSIGY